MTVKDRVSAICKGLRGGTIDPNRCICAEQECGQYAGTPHRHYNYPPFKCARCKCEAYIPAVADTSVVVSP